MRLPLKICLLAKYSGRRISNHRQCSPLRPIVNGIEVWRVFKKCMKERIIKARLLPLCQICGMRKRD